MVFIQFHANFVTQLVSLALKLSSLTNEHRDIGPSQANNCSP